MSGNWSSDVAEFMRAMGQRLEPRPGAEYLPSKETTLYSSLVIEEYHEWYNAKGMAESVDGAIDLIWVTLGWLHSIGVDPQPIWDAVQAANMAKTTGPVRADGKRLKPDGWKHPDIAALIDQQRKAK
jgi:predicted HAD superfamily Cof-like phosphohydrolase